MLDGIVGTTAGRDPYKDMECKPRMRKVRISTSEFPTRGDATVVVNTPQTNGDRMRAMSDEEQATWIQPFISHCIVLACDGKVLTPHGVRKRLIDWLQQPAREGDSDEHDSDGD